MEEFVAGAVAGSCGLLVGHPFEVAKVQQQILTQAKFRKMSAVVSLMTKQGLTSGYFRGMSFPLTTQAGLNAIFFGVYSNSLKTLNESYPGQFYTNVFLAGLAGGAAQAPFVNPVETVKTLMQSQVALKDNTVKYLHGPVDCLRYIKNKYGILRINRAFGTTFLRDVPAFGLYMIAYEKLDNSLPIDSKLWSSVIAGGVAGTICWLSIIPLDVIKSRMQADIGKVKYKNGFSTARTIFREGGLRIFFRGSLTICLRALPVNMVTFGSWSLTRRFFHKEEQISATDSKTLKSHIFVTE